MFVVSAEGGTPRQLTDGEFNDDGPLSFTPDSKRIVFSANRGADWERDPQESEVFTVDIATQKLTQLTTRDGPDNSPVVSPDGKKIAYLGFDDRLQGYQVTHLYVMDSDGKNSRVVTGAFRPRHRRIRAGPPIAAACTSRMTSAACKSLGCVSLDGKVRTLAEGSVARTSAGRTPRAASASRAMAAWPSRTTRPRGPRMSPPRRRAARTRAHRAQRRPARRQDAGRGARAHLEVLEGSARHPGLGDHAAGLRRGEEISADPRDPRRSVRGLRS